MRLLLALCLLLAAAGLYLLWDVRAEPAAAVVAELGGTRVAYPGAIARDEATAAGGRQERLAFVVAFPDFGPPPRLEPSPDASAARRGRLLVTITAKDDSMEPADRPARLYSRFLESAAALGPEGLVMRRFEAGSPYDLETLYVAPPDGRDFFARCPKAEGDGAADDDFCLFVFREKGLDVELRFAPALLDQWPTLAEGGRGFLAKLIKDAPAQ